MSNKRINLTRPRAALRRERGARRLSAVRWAEQAGVPRGNRLEALKGDRGGRHSIRVNDQYRVCFRWTVGGAEDIEIVDDH